jgi:hypothetical protein
LGLARAGFAYDAQTRHAHQQTSGYEQDVNYIHAPSGSQYVDKPDHGGKYPSHDGKGAYRLRAFRRRGWRGRLYLPTFNICHQTSFFSHHNGLRSPRDALLETLSAE